MAEIDSPDPGPRPDNAGPAIAGALPGVTDSLFRLLVDSVRDYAIFMLDREGLVITWNHGAQLTKGYTAGEIIGRHFSVFYTQEDLERDWPRQELASALREGRLEDEGWRLRRDGSRFWASVVITALFDAQGRHQGYAKVTRDLTDRHRIRTLESQERYLYQVLATLGHELRNPLAPISNAVAILRMHPEVPASLWPVRDILDRQVAHLSRLVDDLLDVGRVVSGNVRMDRVEVSLQDVVTESVEAIAPLMRERGHRLDVEVPEQPVRVLGDRVRLVQVLSNLLHNAAKFTPDGGRVRLKLARSGEDAELVVDDTGPGIAPAELEHVFNLFAQLDQGPGRVHDGLGVGLGLVHHIVQRHGGQVSAFSSGEAGKGAEFVVRLPLLETVDAPPA